MSAPPRRAAPVGVCAAHCGSTASAVLSAAEWPRVMLRGVTLAVCSAACAERVILDAVERGEIAAHSAAGAALPFDDDARAGRAR